MPRELFGYALETEMGMERARRGPGSRGTVRILPRQSGLLERQGELVSYADEPDRLAFALADTSDGLVAWCEGSGAYLIDGAEALVRAEAAVATPVVEHRLGATIVPLLLAERGDLALHAAAVVADGRAVLLCGPTGRGKSTLAAALALGGHTVLSEDGVVVSMADGTPVTWPGQRGIRAAADTWRALGAEGVPPAARGRDKVLMAADDGDVAGPVAVAAVVVLDERGGEAVALERIPPADAVAVLVPFALHGGPQRLPTAFRQVAALADRVPVLRGRVPDRLETVGTAAGELLAAALG